MQATKLNTAQIELLRMMSFVKTDDSMKELKSVISHYFAKKAKDEMDKMWESGEMNEEKFNRFRTLHERLPYIKSRSYKSLRCTSIK